jgi:hypothetical protein
MDKRTYWRVVVWGSGFGSDGGLRRTPEEADHAVEDLIQSLGWEPEMVSVEELYPTPAVTFRKDVTPRPPIRRPSQIVAPLLTFDLLMAC